MSIRTKYYFGLPGAYDIIDPALANTDIFCITRSGTVYTDGSPTDGLTCSYQNATGRIVWANPFTGPAPDLPVSINDLEKVSVKFRE